MPIKNDRPFNRKLRVVTDLEGNEYVIQMFVVGTDYVIPYDGNQYWEHFQVPKEKWIPIDDVDYSKFNFTREEYLEVKAESEKKTEEILAKFHASF